MYFFSDSDTRLLFLFLLALQFVEIILLFIIVLFLLTPGRPSGRA